MSDAHKARFLRGRPPPSLRLFVVAVAGPICVGKTTLCEQLKSLMVDVRYVCQDAFRTPQDARVHPLWQVPDTEDAEFAIDWQRWRTLVAKTIDDARADVAAYRPPQPTINEPYEDPILRARAYREAYAELVHVAGSPGSVFDPAQRERFRAAMTDAIVVLIDGRLAMYDPNVARRCHIGLWLRDSQDVLRRRWIDSQDILARGGTYNITPTWRRLIWPAHIKSSQHLFIASDVEHGAANELYKLVPMQGSDETLLDRACHRLLQAYAKC